MPLYYRQIRNAILHTNSKAFEDTFTVFELPTWLPDFIMGMNQFSNLTAWPIWAEVTCYTGNKTKNSSLSIDRQLRFWITALPKLWNRTTKNGNKSIKYTGSYSTALKASSAFQITLYGRAVISELFYDITNHTKDVFAMDWVRFVSWLANHVDGIFAEDIFNWVLGISIFVYFD